MANLRLTIGGVVGARQIDDAKAAAIADLYYAAVVAPGWPTDTPLPATPQEKLQAVVDAVAKHMLETVREYKRRELRAMNEDAERQQAAAVELWGLVVCCFLGNEKGAGHTDRRPFRY